MRNILGFLIWIITILLAIVLIARMILIPTFTVLLVDGITLLFLSMFIWYKYSNGVKVLKNIFKFRNFTWTNKNIRYCPEFAIYFGFEHQRHVIGVGFDYSDWPLLSINAVIIGFEITFYDWKRNYEHPYYWNNDAPWIKKTNVDIPFKWFDIISRERLNDYAKNHDFNTDINDAMK